MIYLIGGPPKCGKTIVARKLASRLCIPWISSDHIETMVSVSTPKNEFERKFPKSFVRKKTKNSNDLMYSKYTLGQIISLYQKQSQTSWPAIDAMVEFLLAEKIDYIIEGYHIQPKFIKKLLSKYGARKIKPLFFYQEDFESFKNNFSRGDARTNWILVKTKKKDTYIKILQMLHQYGLLFKQEALRNKFRIFDLSENFDKQVKKIVSDLS